jgi:hypothetical protein
VEVIINETEKFQKDLGSFSSKDQRMIVRRLNYLVKAYPKYPEVLSHYLYKVHFRISLQDGFKPSLFIWQLQKDIRLIMTFESDPVFDSLLIYLFRCVRHEDAEKAYREVAEDLYQSNLIINEE